jgi:hypothetical protein
VRVELAGRDFERVAIDVGFGKPPVVEPVTLATSRLLEFAEIASIVVPALAVEQHLAEKVHAYSRTYAGDQPSSRVKDLVDMVVIAHTSTVDGKRLQQAVTAIFERRGTHTPPEALASPPRDWDRAWSTLVTHLAGRRRSDGRVRGRGRVLGPSASRRRSPVAVEPGVVGVVVVGGCARLAQRLAAPGGAVVSLRARRASKSHSRSA